jgi:hypothetical protein
MLTIAGTVNAGGSVKDLIKQQDNWNMFDDDQ